MTPTNCRQVKAEGLLQTLLVPAIGNLLVTDMVFWFAFLLHRSGWSASFACYLKVQEWLGCLYQLHRSLVSTLFSLYRQGNDTSPNWWISVPLYADIQLGDIQPFYPVRYDLYIAEGERFRLNCIVIPTSLQRKVVEAGHKLGHLGTTKTKSMLREKYWFPQMNHTIEQILGQCYECQVTTKQHTEEPIKVSTIPEKPWEVIAVDFRGPYPDGHYNLIAVDKRTRYPEVETTRATSFKATYINDTDIVGPCS